MKKILIILALVAFATPSFAALINGDNGTSIGGAAFKPSTLVNIDLESTPSAYSVGSKHLNGSKCYASTNSDSTITAIDGAVGTAISDSMVTAGTPPALATSCQ